MSLINFNNWKELTLMISQNSLRESSSNESSSDDNTAENPTMALSGVRTSWLILERNIFFFFIARSAFCIIHSCERFDSFKRNIFFQLK